MPECAHKTPLTHLILYTTPDRNSLILSTWNCSQGFLDHTSQITPLQKASTTYLSLSTGNDKRKENNSVYIMFDSGGGPQVEEWMVPEQAGNPWMTNRSITVEFSTVQ